MKIVPITEPREGFVYKAPKFPSGFAVYSKANLMKQLEDCNPNLFDSLKGLNHKKDIVGKLGITHKLEKKIIKEIPRREIEVGDVYIWNNILFYISFYRHSFCWEIFCSSGIKFNEDTEGYNNNFEEFLETEECKKLGFMGIHYDIDWSIE